MMAGSMTGGLGAVRTEEIASFEKWPGKTGRLCCRASPNAAWRWKTLFSREGECRVERSGFEAEKASEEFGG
jgi:hypothetical protein